MRVSVDVDIDDVLHGMDSDEIAQLARDEGFEVIARGTGDHGEERIVERAYLAARRMADLPSEIADLLWKAHGRAI